MTKEDQTVLGNILRILRFINDLSIKDVCEKLKLKQSYVCSIEKGREPFSMAKLQDFASLYNIPSDNIIYISQVTKKLNLTRMQQIKLILEYYLFVENEKEKNVQNTI